VGFGVGGCRGNAGPPGRRVFDAAQPEVEVAARDRLVELREGDLDELRRPAERTRDELGNLDVQADQMRRIAAIGLDERRAPLGIAAPAERRLRLNRQRTGAEKQRTREYRSQIAASVSSAACD
jgi:hypothetical protein